MNESVAVKSAELMEIGKLLKDDASMRSQVNDDPLAFLRSRNIVVEETYADAVCNALMSLTQGEKSLSDAIQASKVMADGVDLARLEAPAPLPPSNLSVTVSDTTTTSAAKKDSELQNFQFRVNEWGLVLVIPEKKIQEILGGGFTAVSLGKALLALFGAAADTILVGTAFAPLVAIAGIWCGIQAGWILAETGAIAAVDSIHHKGVYLTWTWVGLGVTAYLPVPTPITT